MNKQSMPPKNQISRLLSVGSFQGFKPEQIPRTAKWSHITGFVLIGLAQVTTTHADTSWSWNDGLNIEFTDNASLSIGGLIQADAVQFNEDLTPLEDNEDFRRARLLSRLSVGDFRLAADYDLGVSDGWKNAFVQYRGLNRQRFTFGNHGAPFSLEDLSSSRHQPFLERSIASALSPGLLLGASYRTWGNNWSATAGVFADELNDKQRRQLPGNSLNARLTFAPLNSDTTTLHLGVAGEVREIDNGDDVRHRVRVGTRLSDTRLIDTERITGVDRSDTVGLELAAAYRKVRLQAGMTQAFLNRPQEDLDFSSHSIMVSTVSAIASWIVSVQGNLARGIPNSLRLYRVWP